MGDRPAKKLLSPGRSLLSWYRFVLDVRGLDVLIMDGGRGAPAFYDDLILGALCVRIYPHLTVLLTNCVWEPGSRRLNRVFKVSEPAAVDAPPKFILGGVITKLVRLIDHHRIIYSVHGDSDRASFAVQWHVARDRVHFVPYYATTQHAMRVKPPVVDVFAGGNSLRDYRPLLAAADRVDGRIVIATGLPAPASIPTNVRYGPLSPAEYERLAAGARVVIVCLREQSPRSAGQQTYLNSMMLGIPVIVTESPGVRDYITDSDLGVVVRPEPEAIARVLNDALGMPEAGSDARREAESAVQEKYSLNGYVDRLVSLAERVAARD